MKELKVDPKNGYAYASRDDDQRSISSMIGRKHCIYPKAIYEKFNELNIYLPSIAHYFMGDNAMENNRYLFDVLMNDDPKHFWELIGSDYEKLNGESVR